MSNISEILIHFRSEFENGLDFHNCMRVPCKIQEYELVLMILHELGRDQVSELVAVQITRQITGEGWSLTALPYVDRRRGRYVFNDFDDDTRYWQHLKIEFLNGHCVYETPK